MPNVTLVQDSPRETCITPSTVVQVDLLTGPPGPTGSVPNTLVRGYAYPTAQPITPQAWPMIWIDANGTPWYCPAGGTTWTAINTIAPGGV